MEFFIAWLIIGYIGTLSAAFMFRRGTFFTFTELVLAVVAPLTGPVVLVLFLLDAVRRPSREEAELIRVMSEQTRTLEERNRQHAGFSEMIKKSFTDGPQTREFKDGDSLMTVTITGRTEGAGQLLVDVGGVDWAQLRAQKQQLVDLASAGDVGETCSVETLDGVVNFLDSVQDQAALILGDATVFGKDPEES